ncbi:hypothetical protein AVEN_231610-1 [Araneus ventricosus]|uniref:Uncharacterized protein n=1 Tax=Araneus ventricosus TaxID=182803 RepID=A0A4Y2HCG1_ARAVE|nr:hypothetical protein AVEN_264931-1 [Araneus ventricosus]GBM63184.1 hypothetical protein AVEN_231610-1 [Araneus ventricosus]
MRQNFEDKVKSEEIETSNNFAEKGLIELASCVKIESTRRNIYEGDLTSGFVSSLSVEFLPKLTSPAIEKPAINQLLSQINEIARKPKIIEESAFNSAEKRSIEDVLKLAELAAYAKFESARRSIYEQD